MSSPTQIIENSIFKWMIEFTARNAEIVHDKCVVSKFQFLLPELMPEYTINHQKLMLKFEEYQCSWFLSTTITKMSVSSTSVGHTLQIWDMNDSRAI